MSCGIFRFTPLLDEAKRPGKSGSGYTIGRGAQLNYDQWYVSLGYLRCAGTWFTVLAVKYRASFDRDGKKVAKFASTPFGLRWTLGELCGLVSTVSSARANTETSL
jgi:hypothetical protein